ncbi:hypothetical protein [Moraxella porci]|nr:hypothetical protein [Moraxella porci]MDH2272622.1 hypothetical protein [Moraxella porci]
MKMRVLRAVLIIIALMLIAALLFLRHQNNTQPTNPVPVLSSAESS